MSKLNATIDNGKSLREFLSAVIDDSLRKRIVEGEDEEKLSSGKIEVKDVIEKLNIIRSGKSLKDEEVKKGMEDYMNDLDDAEKTALFSFLKGISEIITVGTPGEEATEPAEGPAKVKMEKKPGKQKVSVKPNVIKKPSASKEKSAAPVEDTTPPIKATKK